MLWDFCVHHGLFADMWRLGKRTGRRGVRPPVSAIAIFRQERIPGPPQTFRGSPSSDPAPYLIEWRHYGVGLSENTLYYSERVSRQASGDPAEIELFCADLPGGVSCLVPRVLYTEKPGAFRLTPSTGMASATC